MFAVFFYVALLSIVCKTSYQIVCAKLLKNFVQKIVAKLATFGIHGKIFWSSDIYLIFVCSVFLFCIFYGLIEV